MKKLLSILIVMVFLNVNATSQGTTTTENDFCSYLQQFEGEWKWVSGNQTITIYLRFHRKSTTHGSVLFNQDCLVGWHEYKINNTIIESDYQNRFITLPTDFDNFTTYSIFLNFAKRLNDCANNSRKLSGEIKDYNQANEFMDVSTTVDAAGTTMTWVQKHQEWNGHQTGATGMTLPATITLVKQ